MQQNLFHKEYTYSKQQPSMSSMRTTPDDETLCQTSLKEGTPKKKRKKKKKERKRNKEARTKVIVSFRVLAWKLIIFQKIQQFISA
jgi:hypothetical protein